jgi:excisionase family DNA binding protein
MPAPANEPMHRQEWFTAEEAAEYLRLPSGKAVYQRAARGQILPHRFGARLIRFRRRDLDALMRPCGTTVAPRLDPIAVCAVAGR